MATVLDRSAYIHMVSPQPAMTREGCDADSQEIRIVAATARDSDYVIDAFKAALSPFYGGDHVAHARRVLETHLSGGWDRRGLLSNQQLLLILWQDGARLGILNLVFKRQETCKISPLLLYPETDSSRGLGGVLVEVAEQEATRRGVRQLYCTVAERNEDALLFFLQRGFIVCGRSVGQYKEGETEVLLRRSLVRHTEESIISVVEVHGKEDWAQVRELLLSRMSPPVDGGDGHWLDALHAGGPSPPGTSGAECSESGVFCARDRSGMVRAAAVATAKKGGSIKIMPIAAVDDEAFKALIVDLPSLLADRGRNAFLHISPKMEQLAILQESCWTFEAQIPGAYSSRSITQQWRCPLGEDAPLNLRIHRDYLNLIERGKKTLEIRVGYKHIRKISAGADICLHSRNRTLRCRVDAVRSYRTFAEMLQYEDVTKALPGMGARQALAQLRQIYPPAKERLGVVVLELDPRPVSNEACI